MKYLLITFDFELFLGKLSGTVDKCLLEPTIEIMNVLRKYKIKRAIFFVDTIYLYRLKELSKKNKNVQNDYSKIKDILILLLEEGHYIFPHIHPHWLDACYLEEKNQWDLSNTKKYQLNNCSEEEREYLFEQSFEILYEIVKEYKHNFPIDGYRAGGWSIQPFIGIKNCFVKYGIKYDFSVLPGMFDFTNCQYYDYTPVCSKKEIYRFEDDICEPVDNGMFIEIPITTLKLPPHVVLLNKFLIKWYFLNKHFNYGDGYSITAERIGISKNRTCRLSYVSIEHLNIITLNVYKQYLNKHNYMHFISHPKMLTLYNIKAFDRFLSYATSNYNIETDFRKIAHNFLM